MLIVGAAGSILGTLLVVLIKKTTFYLFPKLVKKTKQLFVAIYMWAIKKTINEHFLLYFKSSPSKLYAYYASLVAKVCISLFVTSWLIFGAKTAYAANSIWVSLGFISLSLVALVITLRFSLSLSAAWRLDIEATVSKSTNEAINEAIEEAIKEVLPKVVDEHLEAQANKKIQPTQKTRG